MRDENRPIPPCPGEGRVGKTMIYVWDHAVSKTRWGQCWEFVPKWDGDSWIWDAVKLLSPVFVRGGHYAELWEGFEEREQLVMSYEDCLEWDKGVDDGIYT